MLTWLREGARTTAAKIFLIVVSIAVVAGLGFGGYFGNIGQRTVLAVGDAEISAETFQIALQRQINRLSQQVGQAITLEQARMFGIDQQLLGQLASEAALDSEADRLNVGVSDDRLAERIASDPIFLQTGGFNRQFFSQVLRQYGITEDDFVADTRSFAARQQLAQGFVGGIAPPTAMMEVANTYANELRTVAFVTLGEADLGDLPEPEEEMLRAFFNERSGDYRAPEFRGITYMTLSEADLADPSSVSVEEVQAAYEAELDALTRSGERTVTQIRFPSATEAETARTRLSDGEAIDAIEADPALGATVTRLGSVQQTGILDASAAEAAFSLSAPGPTTVVEGRFGSLVMFVEAIHNDGVTPLEEVEDRLRQEIAQANARDEIFALYDSIEDARAGGDTLDSVASRFELTLTSVDALDANGFGPDLETVPLPQTDSLIAETFASEVGLENDVLDLADGGFLWFEVTDVQPDRDLSFEEARERVAADWVEDQRDQALRALSSGLVEEMERGRTLQTLAIAQDFPLQRTAQFTRGEAPDELGGPATVAAFEGAEGHFGDVGGPDGTTRLVFLVEDVTRPAFMEGASDVQQLAAQLAPALEDAILSQYVAGLQAQLGVRVNQELLGQLLGGAHGGM